MKDITALLAAFLEKSPSVFHVIRNIREILEERGFQPLDERRKWDLAPGGSYYTVRNGSSLIAFRIPLKPVKSLHITASHSDAPTFKIKPDPEMEAEGLLRLNLEKYGGMLTATWYDRPLTAAGRVLIRENGGIRQQLVYIDRDLLLIPSLAIHMDREANNKGYGNVQNDMPAVFSEGGKKGRFMEIVAAECGCAPEDILGADLFLSSRMKPSVWGADREFISAPKLDDLMCAYGTLAGFAEADAPDDFIQMYCVFDNEEVGSRTKQGAESTFLKDALDRISECLGITRSELLCAEANGMMISADNAHAVHPNHPDKADPVNRPEMNKGIVLKYHANQKYTTDAVSEAYFKDICRRTGVPYQCFVNRSDMNGGSTLGNISNTQVSINTADIGLAMLAMHSSYETAGTRDIAYLSAFTRAFYSEQLPEIL